MPVEAPSPRIIMRVAFACREVFERWGVFTGHVCLPMTGVTFITFGNYSYYYYGIVLLNVWL